VSPCPRSPLANCSSCLTISCNPNALKCQKVCIKRSYQVCNYTLTDTKTFVVEGGYLAPTDPMDPNSGCVWVIPTGDSCPLRPVVTNTTSLPNCTTPTCHEELIRSFNYTR